MRTGHGCQAEPATGTTARWRRAEPLCAWCGRSQLRDEALSRIVAGFERRRGVDRISQRPPPLTALQSAGSDAWLAPDKIKHFAMSYAVTGFAYAGLRTMEIDRGSALGAAALFAFGAGIGKELSDRRGGRGFSHRDLAWNLFGIAAGLVVLDQTR